MDIVALLLALLGSGGLGTVITKLAAARGQNAISAATVSQMLNEQLKDVYVQLAGVYTQLAECQERHNTTAITLTERRAAMEIRLLQMEHELALCMEMRKATGPPPREV